MMLGFFGDWLSFLQARFPTNSIIVSSVLRLSEYIVRFFYKLTLS